ncbi:hypothetical protein [Halorarum salinum]|uniref:Uncharacterized protein n=1 Tax=Halorarum salinum TaxID=2743089 RepID=A0A7D5QLY8_9EURY|nr:hypothetical protein [Halobaculum salinum]QLG63085.1 hypothetical protein HUG12_15630 [Halobaculum salinum]
MTDDTTGVYRALRSLRYGGGERHDAGDLLVNPPAWVPTRLDRALERLDEDGRLPRDVLRHMQYQRLQQLAAEGDVDDVDGNSSAEEIIDSYALDEDEEPEG